MHVIVCVCVCFCTPHIFFTMLYIFGCVHILDFWFRLCFIWLSHSFVSVRFWHSTRACIHHTLSLLATLILSLYSSLFGLSRHGDCVLSLSFIRCMCVCVCSIRGAFLKRNLRYKQIRFCFLFRFRTVWYLCCFRARTCAHNQTHSHTVTSDKCKSLTNDFSFL